MVAPLDTRHTHARTVIPQSYNLLSSATSSVSSDDVSCDIFYKRSVYMRIVVPDNLLGRRKYTNTYEKLTKNTKSGKQMAFWGGGTPS